MYVCNRISKFIHASALVCREHVTIYFDYNYVILLNCFMTCLNLSRHEANYSWVGFTLKHLLFCETHVLSSVIPDPSKIFLLHLLYLYQPSLLISPRPLNSSRLILQDLVLSLFPPHTIISFNFMYSHSFDYHLFTDHYQSNPFIFS